MDIVALEHTSAFGGHSSSSSRNGISFRLDARCNSPRFTSLIAPTIDRVHAAKASNPWYPSTIPPRLDSQRRQFFYRGSLGLSLAPLRDTTSPSNFSRNLLHALTGLLLVSIIYPTMALQVFQLLAVSYFILRHVRLALAHRVRGSDPSCAENFVLDVSDTEFSLISAQLREFRTCAS
ncbi:hypothetical protein C8R47DRAFT_248701 [Mycena vitilis]|nr:hypothetical protein C8R47DRAFT_248701 [Mycena vitilis]